VSLLKVLATDLFLATNHWVLHLYLTTNHRIYILHLATNYQLLHLFNTIVITIININTYVISELMLIDLVVLDTIIQKKLFTYICTIIVTSHPWARMVSLNQDHYGVPSPK
jgi:TM2 domain-containing membrane protein YozV